MRQCPLCSAQYDDDTRRCPVDGAELGAGDILVGTDLDGKYRIKALLGRGGMGAVYRATQLALKRDVAIKIVRNELHAPPATIKRFEREATIVARLRHPNVIVVYDFGWTESVGAYLVMELLSGRSLRDELGAAGRLAPRRAPEILRQVCDGLEAAHAEGVVHRDLKPDNIFLEAAPDARVSAKVLDFGIAKLHESVAGSGAPLTADGTLVGTAHYMSPEQIEGQPLDARSDVYSLGCVLYEMLVGHPPFPSGSFAAVLLAHISRTAPPPSRLRPELPTALDAVVLRALAKSPDDRFASADALARAVESALASAPAVESGAPTIAWDGASPVAHSPVETSVSSAAGAECAIESLAVLPFENASGDPDAEYLSEGITDQLIDDLTALDAVRVTARSVVFRYRRLELDPLETGRKLGVDAVVVGRVRLLGERIVVNVELVDIRNGWRIWGDRYTRPLADLLTVQEEIAADVMQKLRTHVTGSRKTLAERHSPNNEAYQEYLKGQFFLNLRPQALRESLAHFTRAAERDPDYALAHAGRAAAYAVLGSWEAGSMPPTDAMPRAAVAARRALEIDPRCAEAHASLAYVYLHFDRDWASAKRECDAAIAANPRYATAHHWYSHYLLATGDAPRSLEVSKRCLALDPLDLILNVHMAWHAVFAHDYESAIEQSARVRELEPNFFWSFFFSGVALEQLGRLDDAIDALRRAVELNRDVTYPAAALGHAYAAAGDAANATKLLDDLVAASKRSYVPSYDVATLLGGLGRMDEAFDWLERAAAERSAWMVYLRADPRWSAHAGDARFVALAERLGLPEPGDATR
jgi:serine/threonine protein kinase/tetratricopeptide (TPR) repeat protein